METAAGTLPGRRLDDPARLQAVREARIHDAADREVFDRLTELVTALLDVPMAQVTVVEAERQLTLSCVGLPEPWASRGELPLSHSFCMHAVLSGEPLVIEDARTHPLVRDNPAIEDLGIVAYAGIPLATPAGHVIGSFCAMDSKPRAWGETDLRVLGDLAATVMAYVDGRPHPAQAGAGGLNIAAVARRTGVAPDTLRKWERRYGVLRPSRTSGGQRRYDDVDVARVEWLRDRLAEGFRIGAAAALLDESRGRAVDTPEDLRDALVTTAASGDPSRLAALVEQAFTLHPVAVAVEQIVAPALREVGDPDRPDSSSIAEEHLLSEAVRSRLKRMLADRRPGLRGKAVLACAPGERHELGLLALAVLLQADGWLVAYLGADAPVESTLALASRIGADVVCVSFTLRESLDRFAEELDRVPEDERPQFVAGGPGLADGRALAFTTLEAGLDDAVARLRAA